MFDKNSVYLPTKKIGKNNPKAAEIEADNTARQEWNRTADLALVSGIEEAKILEIKQTENHDKAGIIYDFHFLGKRFLSLFSSFFINPLFLLTYSPFYIIM